MSTALAAYEEPLEGLTQWRPPSQVLAEAQMAAKELVKVISLKAKPVKFNNETYLEFEDWQTCAKFYGVTAKVESTGYVNYDGVRGFEATAVAIDAMGREISRAEALCLNDEENWGMVPKYEWKDELDANGKKIWDAEKKRYRSNRVQTGETAKPLFQLKSMAQTRACSKVLRQVFSWVVVLAGYKPTPAEEMTGNEHGPEDERDERPQVTSPQRASDSGASSKPELVQVSGVIESVKLGKEGSVWFSVDKKIVAVNADLASDAMAVGGKLSVKAVKRATEKSEYYWTVEVLEATAPGGSGGGGGAPATASAEKQAEFVGEMDAAMSGPSADSKIDLGKLMEEGKVQKATEAPAAGSGKIGPKRAQRLYAMINQNKAATGFSEASLKQILARMEPPLEHLSDLPMEMYQIFEQMAEGKADWKKHLEG